MLLWHAQNVSKEIIRQGKIKRTILIDLSFKNSVNFVKNIQRIKKLGKVV